MREAEEAQIWKRLGARNRRPGLATTQVGGAVVDLSAPCVVIGGRNGAGKSRLLRSLSDTLGSKGLYLDLHHLSEQALILLRSRKDVEEMADEAGLFLPDDDRLEDLERIIGLKYTSVEWSQLDLIPAEEAVAETFKWAGDQPTVPYFRVAHHDSTYSGQEMGLGEFTMHFLLWIIEQYRAEEGMTLLLDEPDAYLPPVGVKRLMRRLLHICNRRGWQLILSTHAEEMIRTSVSRDAFVALYVDETGETKAVSSREDRDIATPLLTRPPVERVLFCEDESAYYLIQSMLSHANQIERGAVVVLWGNGHGYIRKLRDYLPKPARLGISFAFAFDGDQWNAVTPDSSRWPSRFLPTVGDPDAMFRQSLDVSFLSTRIGAHVSVLEAFLDRIDGEENHDWVNKIADHFGRVVTLTALADSWVQNNEAHADEFVQQLHEHAEFLLHSTQIQARKELAAAEEDSLSASPAANGPTPEPIESSGPPV